MNSIHTYRDALVHEAETGEVEGIVTTAYFARATCSGDGAETGYEDMAMPGRLLHPEYRRRFRFGVVSLRPGMQAGKLRETLRTIVADATA